MWAFVFGFFHSRIVFPRFIHIASVLWSFWWSNNTWMEHTLFIHSSADAVTNDAAVENCIQVEAISLCKARKFTWVARGLDCDQGDQEDASASAIKLSSAAHLISRLPDGPSLGLSLPPWQGGEAWWSGLSIALLFLSSMSGSARTGVAFHPWASLFFVSF